MSDLLYMTHPGLEGDHAPAATTQEAFDALWSKKGWQLVENEPPAETPATLPPPPPAKAPAVVIPPKVEA